MSHINLRLWFLQQEAENWYIQHIQHILNNPAKEIHLFQSQFCFWKGTFFKEE